MSEPGDVTVISTVSPKNGADFPVIRGEDAQLSHQVFTDVAARDAFPAGKLVLGMQAHVLADGKDYRLTALSPATWEEVVFGGGGGGGAVDSVNGQTGVVELDAADVGADATGTAAAAVSAHAAQTVGVHGISFFAATLLDDANAAAARATLGAASNAREGVETLASDTITVDFATQAEKRRAMAGAATITGTGYAAGLGVGLTLVNDTAGALAVSVAALWKWPSGAPTTVGAGKTLRIDAVSTGTTEGDVVAAWIEVDA